MNQKEHFGSPLLSAGNCDEYIMFLILSNPHKVRLIPILELGEWGSEKSNNLDHLTSTKLKTQDSKQGTLTLTNILKIWASSFPHTLPKISASAFTESCKRCAADRTLTGCNLCVVL